MVTTGNLTGSWPNALSARLQTRAVSRALQKDVEPAGNCEAPRFGRVGTASTGLWDGVEQWAKRRRIVRLFDRAGVVALIPQGRSLNAAHPLISALVSQKAIGYLQTGSIVKDIVDVIEAIPETSEVAHLRRAFVEKEIPQLVDGIQTLDQLQTTLAILKKTAHVRTLGSLGPEPGTGDSS
jgi:hypothetical protein